MAQLADVADHLIMLFHGQGADVLESQHLGQLLRPRDARRSVLLRGGDDEVRRGEVHLRRVLHAGSLPPRHGVTGDELHTVRAKGLHRLHKAGLDAGHIREDAAGLEEGPVGLEPLDQILQMALAAVDAVHMEPGLGQLQRVLAAQQTQTHNEITLCFIQHPVPPRPMA